MYDIGELAYDIPFLYCCLLLAMAMKLSDAVTHMKQALVQCGVSVNTIKKVLKTAIQDKDVQDIITKTTDTWRNNGIQLLDEANAGQKIKPMKYIYRYAGPVFTFSGKIYRQWWEGETKAVTAGRALANLCKQFKDGNGLAKDFMLSLDPSRLEKGEEAPDAERREISQPIAQIKKCPICGARLTDGGFCPRCDDGAEDLDEKVEKHDKLNPKLWDGDKLKPEVADKIMSLSTDFIKELYDDGIKFDLADVRIVGSNCSYNYTDRSDLDVHIVADTSDLECQDDLYPSLYNAYKSLWNKNHSVKFYGIPVEIFVEVEGKNGIEEAKTAAPLKSAGVYSVLNDKWIKEPEAAEIPDVDQEAVDAAVGEWTDRYQDLLAEIKESADAPAAIESLCEASDRAEAKLNKINEFLSDAYDLRGDSLAAEGEFGIGNLVFKELRNRGILDRLKDLRNEIESKDYSLPDDTEREPIAIEDSQPAAPFEKAKNQLLSAAKNCVIDVDCRGKFTIKNLSVGEAKLLIDKLSKADFAANVSQKESGQFDLRTVSPSRLPNRFIEISGELIK